MRVPLWILIFHWINRNYFDSPFDIKVLGDLGMLSVFINHLAFDHDLISMYIKMDEPGQRDGSSNAANGIQVQVSNKSISLPLSEELPESQSSFPSLTPSRYKLFRLSLIYLIDWILAKLKYQIFLRFDPAKEDFISKIQ